MKPLFDLFPRFGWVLLAVVPHLAGGHPCPYPWNIEFPEDTEIRGTSLSDFVTKFNEAVRKQTQGQVQQAIHLDLKPDTIKKVPENSPYSGQMDELIRRYFRVQEARIKKGVPAYGTAPVAIEFQAKFPVACQLDAMLATSMNYEETPKGLRITRQRNELECRAYPLNEKFLATLRENQSEGRIPAGKEAVAYTFASYSGMTWAFYTLPDPAKREVEDSILEGVALFLPEKKVVLAIETNDKHEEMVETMRERGYLEAVPP